MTTASLQFCMPCFCMHRDFQMITLIVPGLYDDLSTL